MLTGSGFVVQGISGALDREDNSCSPHSINKEVSLVQDVMEMEQSMVQSIQLASFYLQKSSHEPHVYTCSVLLYSKISTDFHEFVYLLVAGCLLQPSDQEPWCSHLSKWRVEWGEGVTATGGGERGSHLLTDGACCLSRREEWGAAPAGERRPLGSGGVRGQRRAASGSGGRAE